MKVDAFRRFLKSLGEAVDIFGRPNFDRYLPDELRGLSIEQRAAKLVRDAFNVGVDSVKQKRPELKHVKTPQSRSYSG